MTAKQADDQVETETEAETKEPLEGQQMLPLGSNGDGDGDAAPGMKMSGFNAPADPAVLDSGGSPTAQQVHRAVRALPRAERTALNLACEGYTKRDLKKPAKDAGFRSVKQHGLTTDRAVRLIRMAIGFHGTVEELVDLLVAGRMAAALAGDEEPMGPGTSKSSSSVL